MAMETIGLELALFSSDSQPSEWWQRPIQLRLCARTPHRRRSIGLVVAGDAAYNDVHLYLAESNAQKRQEWIAALDKIQSLNPRAVVASHKRPENDDDPRIIEETRQYIRDFDRLA